MPRREDEYPSAKLPFKVSASRDRSAFYYDRCFSSLRLAEKAARRAHRRGYDVTLTQHDFSDLYVGKSAQVLTLRYSAPHPFD